MTLQNENIRLNSHGQTHHLKPGKTVGSWGSVKIGNSHTQVAKLWSLTHTDSNLNQSPDTQSAKFLATKQPWVIRDW